MKPEARQGLCRSLRERNISNGSTTCTLSRRPSLQERRDAVAVIIAGSGVLLGASACGLGLLGILTKLQQSSVARASQLAQTVIGTKDQPRNSARSFVNHANGQTCLLIHLPNGKFVACERACTHQGVFVNYDQATHRLICPAHGAIFDPAQHGAIVQGPATRPLPQVKLQLEGNGTITQ